jgi:hypothetical protein
LECARASLSSKHSAFFQIELLCKGGARNCSDGLLQDLVETGLVLLISQFHRMIS